MAAVVDVVGRHRTSVSCRPWASPLAPAFRSSPAGRAIPLCELRKAKGASQLINSVPLIDLKPPIRTRRLSCGGFRSAALVLGATLLLAGCGHVNRFQTAAPSSPATPATKPKSTFVQSPAAEKEHERILSTSDTAKFARYVGR